MTTMKVVRSEAEWQEEVITLAHMLGWKHLHVRRTIGRGKKWVTSTNREGWPDLFLWHPKGGVCAIELKVKPNKATPNQLDVLAELTGAGVPNMVAYPEDLEAVHRLLVASRTPSQYGGVYESKERARENDNDT